MADSTTATIDASSDGVTGPDPAGSVDVDPLDRMLLTADGTVTTLLEACTDEPISTATIRLAGPAPLEQLLIAGGRWWHPDARLLDLAPQERSIVRQVILRGERSGVAYVLAESLVAPDRLPDLVAARLRHPGSSLGRLLAASELETRREVLDIVAVRAGEAGDHLGVPPGAQLARRTYTIGIGRQPIAAVTEWIAPGRLAALTRATGRAGVAVQLPRRRARDGHGHARRGAEFVTDL